MNIGEDLSLDMLGGSQDAGLGNDLSLDLDGALSGAPPSKDKEKDDINIDDKTSEKPTASESVASEEGKEKTPVATTSSPPSDKLPGILSSLASHFHETGVLPSLNVEENTIDSVDKLQEAIQAEITNGIDANVKAYRAAMEQGVQQDTYVTYQRMKAQLDGYTDEVINKDENATLRFNIIAQDFLNRKFSKEDASKFAQRSVDLGEDMADAKAALVRLKAFNEDSYQADVQAAAAKEQADIDEVTKFINTMDEVIKGVKIPRGVKDNLIKQMTTAVDRDANGNPLSTYGKALQDNPTQTRTITEYLFLVTKGFTDFSKLTGAIATSATKNIDEVLRGAGTDFLQNGTAPKQNENFTLGDGLMLE